MFYDGMCPVSHKIDGRRMRTYVHGDMFPMHKFLCRLHETKMCVRGGGSLCVCIVFPTKARTSWAGSLPGSRTAL